MAKFTNMCAVAGTLMAPTLEKVVTSVAGLLATDLISTKAAAGSYNFVAIRTRPGIPDCKKVNGIAWHSTYEIGNELMVLRGAKFQQVF